MTPVEQSVRAALVEVAAARLCVEAAAKRLERAVALARDLLTRLAQPARPRVPDVAADETVATDTTYPRRRRVAAGATPSEVALLRAAEDFQPREDTDADALRKDAHQ